MKIEDRVRATLVARADAVDGRATKTALNPLRSHEAPRSPGPVGGWTRRRAVTIATAAAVFVAAGLFAWSAFMQTAPDVTTGPPVASLSPATCQYGPWAELCPEADWVRRILRVAGITRIGNTGSAIVARSGGEFYVWTTHVDEEGPVSKLVSEGGFERVQSVDGAAVYSDGVRFLWQVGGLYVWIQSGEEGFSIKPDLVATLVLSSQRTPESATQLARLRFRIQDAINAVAAAEAVVQRDFERLQVAKHSGDIAKAQAIRSRLELARAAVGEAEVHVRQLTHRLNILISQTTSP